MIHLTIDGIPVEVEKGTTILQAARQIGVEIPTLCYLEDVLPDGSCRLCVVEEPNLIRHVHFAAQRGMKYRQCQRR